MNSTYNTNNKMDVCFFFLKNAMAIMAHFKRLAILNMYLNKKTLGKVCASMVKYRTKYHSFFKKYFLV